MAGRGKKEWKGDSRKSGKRGETTLKDTREKPMKCTQRVHHLGPDSNKSTVERHFEPTEDN